MGLGRPDIMTVPSLIAAAGQNPAGAVATIVSLGMFPVVFQIPARCKPGLRADPGPACSHLMSAAAEILALQVRQTRQKENVGVERRERGGGRVGGGGGGGGGGQGEDVPSFARLWPTQVPASVQPGLRADPGPACLHFIIAATELLAFQVRQQEVREASIAWGGVGGGGGGFSWPRKIQATTGLVSSGWIWDHLMVAELPALQVRQEAGMNRKPGQTAFQDISSHISRR